MGPAAETTLNAAERFLLLAFRAKRLHRMRARELAVFCALLDLMPAGEARYLTIQDLARATTLCRNSASLGAVGLCGMGVVERRWAGDDRGCCYTLVSP